MKRFNFLTAELRVDEDEPDGYRAKYAPIRTEIGADLLAANLVVLEQGESLCPYHYEVAEEEWLLVIEGRPTVRTPDGDAEFEAGDVVCFPVGPEGAHKISNAREQPARVIMISNRVFPTLTVYPDSDKLGVWTEDKRENIIVKRDSGVDYFHGEGGD